MKYIYTIKDLVADDCGSLFYSNNDESAQRSFLIAIKNLPKEEYLLLKVGTFDEKTGEIVSSVPFAVGLSLKELEGDKDGK